MPGRGTTDAIFCVAANYGENMRESPKGLHLVLINPLKANARSGIGREWRLGCGDDASNAIRMGKRTGRGYRGFSVTDE